MKFIYFIIFILFVYTGTLFSQNLNEKNETLTYLTQFSHLNKFVSPNEKQLNNFYPESDFLYTQILPQKIFLGYELYSNKEINNLNLITLSLNLDELNDYDSFINNIKNKSKVLNTLYESNREMAFIDVKQDNSELIIYYYFDNEVFPIDTMRNLQHFVNTYQIHSS